MSLTSQLWGDSLEYTVPRPKIRTGLSPAKRQIEMINDNLCQIILYVHSNLLSLIVFVFSHYFAALWSTFLNSEVRVAEGEGLEMRLGGSRCGKIAPVKNGKADWAFITRGTRHSELPQWSPASNYQSAPSCVQASSRKSSWQCTGLSQHTRKEPTPEQHRHNNSSHCLHPQQARPVSSVHECVRGSSPETAKWQNETRVSWMQCGAHQRIDFVYCTGKPAPTPGVMERKGQLYNSMLQGCALIITFILSLSSKTTVSPTSPFQVFSWDVTPPWYRGAQHTTSTTDLEMWQSWVG